jgi:integrase
VAAVRLILFTGCRSSEALGHKWPDVRGHRLHLRDSKTGPRTVWFGTEGRAALDAAARGRLRVLKSDQRQRLGERSGMAGVSVAKVMQPRGRKQVRSRIRAQ